jgi:hypothetical protein
MQRFPSLHRAIVDALRDVLDDALRAAKPFVAFLVARETEFINFNHPDFRDAAQETQLMLQQARAGPKKVPHPSALFDFYPSKLMALNRI